MKSIEYNEDERRWARRAHLVTLLTYPAFLLPLPFHWIGFGNVFFPFLLWLSRPKKTYSKRQALEAIYLQTLINLMLIGLHSKLGDDRTAWIFLGLGPIVFLHLILLGFGVFRSTFGREHHYPFSFLPMLFGLRQTRIQWKELKKKFANKSDFKLFKDWMTRFIERKQEVVRLTNSLPLEFQSLPKEFLKGLEEIEIALQNDPSQYKSITPFLETFPETVTSILKQWLELKSESKTSERINMLQSFFRDLEATTEQVIQKLRSNQEFQLDIEIQAMKNSLKLGGYS